MRRIPLSICKFDSGNHALFNIYDGGQQDEKEKITYRSASENLDEHRISRKYVNDNDTSSRGESI